MWSVFCVLEFEPSLFEPGVYFYIKYIGKYPGLTNEFQRSMVFKTDKFERPKFDYIEVSHGLQFPKEYFSVSEGLKNPTWPATAEHSLAEIDLSCMVLTSGSRLITSQ